MADGLRRMPSLDVELDLSPAQLLAYYRGEARQVHARATTGQRVQFPASILQRFVTVQGVRGRFRLEFDAHHKFVRLIALG